MYLLLWAFLFSAVTWERLREDWSTNTEGKDHTCCKALTGSEVPCVVQQSPASALLCASRCSRNQVKKKPIEKTEEEAVEYGKYTGKGMLPTTGLERGLQKMLWSKWFLWQLFEDSLELQRDKWEEHSRDVLRCSHKCRHSKLLEQDQGRGWAAEARQGRIWPGQAWQYTEN